MSNHNEICFTCLVLIVDNHKLAVQRGIFWPAFEKVSLDFSVFDCDQVATTLLFFVTIEQSMEFNKSFGRDDFLKWGMITVP